MLTVDEEAALETYMIDMAQYDHPLSTEKLRLKVALMTQERPTSFTDGIPEKEWLCWFKKRHLDLIRRQAHGLELARAKGLCAENVASFYKNLEKLYQKYQYPSDHVWNCNESGTQAGRSGGGRVWTKRGTRSVHSLLPNEHECLTVLTCINVAGQDIHGFYIFRGKRIRDNYISFYEDGAAMAMHLET